MRKNRAAQTGIAKGIPSLFAIFVAGSLQKLLCTSVLLEWNNEFSIAKGNKKHGKFLCVRHLQIAELLEQKRNPSVRRLREQGKANENIKKQCKEFGKMLNAGYSGLTPKTIL